MSVKVDLDKLGDTLADFPFGFLITVGDDFRPHTVAVTPVFGGGALTIEPVGNTTRGNAGAHSVVTVLWPPREPTGYSLIVDGRAEVSDVDPDTDTARCEVVPTKALLHRNADEPSAAKGCCSRGRHWRVPPSPRGSRSSGSRATARRCAAAQPTAR